MGTVTIPYKPREAFLPFHFRAERWAVIVAHRRAGKTVACINDLIKRAITDGKKDGRYAYIAPFYSQAKGVAWDYLLHYSEKIRKDKNASELWVELRNGARVRLFGADNADALRGLYFDGIIADEYADWKPGVYNTVIRPALSDRKGWAVFIGTPKGHNAFYDLYQDAQKDGWYRIALKASETGIIPDDELKDARTTMSDDQYEQEYECSFEAAIVGAYFGKELKAAYDDNRVCRVPIEQSLPVYTFWDLGIGDDMAIWLMQPIGKELRLISCYNNSGEGMGHYANWLKDFERKHSVRFDTHYAPHDIEVRELMSGKSRKQTAEEMGLRFETVKRCDNKADSIEALRRIFPRLIFDSERCEMGIKAVSFYHRKYDEYRKVFSDRPEHDWSSNLSDALQQLALVWVDKEPVQKPARAPQRSGWMSA